MALCQVYFVRMVCNTKKQLAVQKPPTIQLNCNCAWLTVRGAYFFLSG